MAEQTGPDVVEEARKLSFEQRVAHKNIKVRIDAFDQLTSTVLENKLLPIDDPRVKEAVNLIPQGLNDSNALVKDKALGALVSLFNKVKEPDSYSRYADKVLPLVVNKCLKEQKSLKKIKEVCLLFVEYEQGEKVIDNLISGTESKLPKIQLNAIDIISEIFGEFGTKAVPWKKLLPVTVVMSDSKDNKVRGHVKDILTSIAKCEGGEAVRQLVYAKFREAFQKDISNILDIQKNAEPPKRVTVSQQARAMDDMEVDVGSAPDGNQPEAAAEQVQDFYEDATPENINSLFGSSFYTTMEKGKWKDKVQILKEDINEKLQNIVRMSMPDDAIEIAKVLKTAILKDSNINVVGECASTAMYLAKGTRQQFGACARGISPALLERLKEKNPVASSKINDCLDAFAKYCFTLVEIADDLKVVLQHKNPRVRELSCDFIARSASQEESSSLAKALKELGQALISALADATASVREKAAEAMSVIYYKVKSPLVQKLLQQLDDTRQQKIMELVQKLAANDKPKQKDKSAPQAGSNAGARPSQSQQPLTSSQNPVPQQGSFSQHQDVPLGIQLSKNSAGQSLSSWFGFDTAKMLADDDWKQREAALQQIANSVKSQQSFDVNQLLQCLLVLPGLADPNSSVCVRLFEIIGVLCSQSQPLNPAVLQTCVSGTADKLSEPMLKQYAFEILLKLAQSAGPQQVISTLTQYISNHSNPTVTAEGIVWVGQFLTQFGVDNVVDPMAVATSIKPFLTHSVPGVRNQAVEVFGVLHRFVGSQLEAVVSDLKPPQLHPIKAAFDRNPHQAHGFVPTKYLDGSTVQQQMSQEAVDVSVQLCSDSVLTRLNSSQWSMRQDCLKEIESLVKRTGCIKGNLSRELVAAIKARLVDQNVNVIASAITTTTALASAIGQSFERIGKVLLTAALKNLNSNKNYVRMALFNFLTAWYENVGVSVPCQELCTTIASGKCSLDGKREAMEWVQKNILNNQVQKREMEEGEVQAMLWLCAAGVADKSVDVRDSANKTLSILVSYVGQAGISAGMMQLDGAAQKQLKEALSKTMMSENSDVYMEVDSPQKQVSKQQATQQLQSGFGARPPTAGNRVSTRSKKSLPFNNATNNNSSSQDGDNMVLMVNDKKDERSRRYRGRLMGKFEIRGDEIEMLKHEVSLVASQPLLKLMFSKEFRDHILAAESICGQMRIEGVLCNLDLVFRWAIVRIHDEKLQSQLRLLEMIKYVLGKVQEAGGQLDEYEVTMLLPGVVDKWGHNQERVKVSFREVVAMLYALHSPHKIASIVAEGLESKNFKSRAESIDEIGRSMSNYGVDNILKGPKERKIKSALASIAKMVGDKDKGVRGAALGVMEIIYQQQGENVWYLVGRLTTQQEDLIRDRLKYTEKQLKMRGIEPGYAYNQNNNQNNNQFQTNSNFGCNNSVNNSVLDNTNNSFGYSMDQDKTNLSNMMEQENTPPQPSSIPVEGCSASYVQSDIEMASMAAPMMQLDVEMVATLSPRIDTQSPSLPQFQDQMQAQQQHAQWLQQQTFQQQQLPSNTLNQPQMPFNLQQSIPQQQYQIQQQQQYQVQQQQQQQFSQLQQIPQQQQMQQLQTQPYQQISSTQQLPPPSPFHPPKPAYPHRSLEECRTSFVNSIVQCQSANLLEATQAMKLLCYELIDIAKYLQNPEVPEELRAVYKQEVDNAICTLARQVDRMFFNAYECAQKDDLDAARQAQRGPKYVTNCLLQLFSMDELMPYVKQDSIQLTIGVFSYHLVLNKTPTLENGSDLTKAMNIMMSRICYQFTLTRPNDIYTVCLTLMRVPPKVVVDQGELIEGRFKEVLVKFLIKVTKKMDQVLSRISVRKLLFDIHTYFVAIGSEELRKRGIDDKPNRIVKTILNEICKLKGAEIVNEVGDLVQKHPPPIVLSYIDANMQTLYSQQLISALPPRLVQDNYTTAVRPPTASVPMDVDDQQNGDGIQQGQQQANALLVQQQDEKYQLSIIFKNIGKKESQQQGLEQLYDFLQEHPNTSLDNCLTRASSGFKNFVNQALNQIAKQKEMERQMSRNRVLRQQTGYIEQLKQQADQLLQQVTQGQGQAQASKEQGQGQGYTRPQ